MNYTLNFTANEVNEVFVAVQRLPWEVANPIIIKMKEQVNIQNEAAKIKDADKQ